MGLSATSCSLQTLGCFRPGLQTEPGPEPTGYVCHVGLAADTRPGLDLGPGLPGLGLGLELPDLAWTTDLGLGWAWATDYRLQTLDLG
jgi:hypothetical protein